MFEVKNTNQLKRDYFLIQRNWIPNSPCVSQHDEDKASSMLWVIDIHRTSAQRPLLLRSVHYYHLWKALRDWVDSCHCHFLIWSFNNCTKWDSVCDVKPVWKGISSCVASPTKITRSHGTETALKSFSQLTDITRLSLPCKVIQLHSGSYMNVYIM